MLAATRGVKALANGWPLALAIVMLTAMAGSGCTEKLDAEPGSELPLPKRFTISTLVNNVSDRAVYHRQLDATIPADLGAVLAFYRSELGKLGWKESSEHAVVKFDSVQLAFATPDGSALLKLGLNKGSTTVKLAQKIPAEAAAAYVLPNPGQARLMFSNSGGDEATLTINGQTVKLVPGTGGFQSASPTLELAPGAYPYSLEISGVTRNDTIELTADDVWNLTIASAGKVIAQQIY